MFNDTPARKPDRLLGVSKIIDLVSVLPEFAEQSQLLCRVSVDFGLRLLSMVPLSKSFHNIVIFFITIKVNIYTLCFQWMII